MVFDGQWKRELRTFSREIAFWRKMTMFSHIAEHRLNRAILYSAIILRKVMEDEKEAEEIITKSELPKVSFELLHAKIAATQYLYIAEKGWTVRGAFRADDYGKRESVPLDAQLMCHWLVHSCIWSLVHDGELRYAGFLVASDRKRETHIHYVTFDEWLRVIELAIKHGSF